MQNYHHPAIPHVGRYIPKRTETRDSNACKPVFVGEFSHIHMNIIQT